MFEAASVSREESRCSESIRATGNPIHFVMRQVIMDDASQEKYYALRELGSIRLTETKN
jgi:hypothetical protein